MALLDDLKNRDEQINEFITQQNAGVTPEQQDENVEIQQQPTQQQPDLTYLTQQNDSLRQQNDVLNNEVQSLKQSMQSLQQMIQQQNKKPEEPTFKLDNTPSHIDLTDDEATTMDSKVVTKIVSQLIEAKLQPIVAQLNKVTDAYNEQFGQVNSNLQQTAQSQFENTILQAVSNARELLSNPNSKFYTWLNNTSSHGVPLRQTFDSAVNSRSAATIISILTAFNKTQTKTKEQDLESQVETPSSSQRTNTPSSTKDVIFPFSKFNSALEQMKKKQIREVDFKKIEEEYNSALMQGRVSFNS